MAAWIVGAALFRMLEASGQVDVVISSLYVLILGWIGMIMLKDALVAIGIVRAPALADDVGKNLHQNLISGRNPHHLIEAEFKTFARAMDAATQLEPRLSGVLSTKGTLS